MVFPPTLKNGKAVIVDNEKSVNQGIADILSSDEPMFFNGERVSSINQYMFEQNDYILQKALEGRILELIKIWETRAKDVSLQFRITEEKLDIIISYRVEGSLKSETFIYPYYRQLNF